MSSKASDPSLLRRIADRDSTALSELYDRYAGSLMALARRILRSPEDAEEVLQEVFLHAWNRAPSYNPDRSSVSTWLMLITRSRAIDRLRNRKVVSKTEIAAQKEKTSNHASAKGMSRVLETERRIRVSEELIELPREQRQVLEMAFYQGLTQREIAEKAGIPLGTVKTRTLLAMKKLRKTLRNEIRELL